MERFLTAALIVFSAVACSANYDLRILLTKFEVENGTLANGSPCDPFYFAGVNCSINLKICIELPPGGVDDDLDHCNGFNNSTSQDGYVNLGSVTNSENEVTFVSGADYNAWTNPLIISIKEQGQTFKGFQLKLKAFHGTGESRIIDGFLLTCNNTNNTSLQTVHYEHPRNGTGKTKLQLAWNVRASSEGTTTTPSGQTTHTTTSPPPVYKDCEDVRTANQPSEVYDIKPASANQSFKVYCEIGELSSYTVIQSRGEGDDFNFDNLTWNDYKSPRGEPGRITNFWLGLDNMRSIINFNQSIILYGMAIELCCGNISAQTTFYENLELHDESDFYRLIGTATNGLGMNFFNNYVDLNSTFSTVFNFTNTDDDDDAEFCDVINYEDENSVVKNGTGGWWFGSCTNNLNGHYYAQGDNSSFADGATCLLKETPEYGTGIEMRTTNVALDSHQYDGISYTRARMALYRKTSGVPMKISKFCEDPQTTTASTSTSPAQT